MLNFTKKSTSILALFILVFGGWGINANTHDTREADIIYTPPSEATTTAGEPIELGPIKCNVNWPRIPIPGGTFDLNEYCQPGASISIGTVIAAIYATALWLGGLIAFGALFYSGFLYIFSGNVPANRSKARGMLVNVAWGMGILLLSWVTLRLINPDITNLKFQEPQKTRVCLDANQINCIPVPGFIGRVSYSPYNAGDPLESARCIGTGDVRVGDSTLNSLANIMCESEELLRKDAHSYLIQAVGNSNCSQEDVDALLLKTETLCPANQPGDEALGITGDTVSTGLCYWQGQYGGGAGISFGASGAVYFPNDYLGDAADDFLEIANLDIIDATSPSAEFVNAIQKNLDAVFDYCSNEDSNPNICILLDEDESNIADLNPARREALRCFCTRDILPSKWNPSFPECN
ncbi:MAG: hypothetical protein A3F94_02865 [Candidatus Spechtbacteria bacterium RIFCSPLOWO2_12_FULL_38_22]|uniref:Uncharacterized protein n=1 Tax=Candidatus Spechtbacteria bacterium RIFCSPLOWO2_12_FULL_38_22 TaxID=1802165 RepID=A0A1G2HIB4_9BACT|nr:MAG: hypothetical protein A2728_02660 [Candidatus Spechtbacteria bacterium RIFCSPHIGHO2_01_FULL_38_11]OGZ60055.1 MAG: hypothetical protein A3E58_01795 [Candidatus Spechtbacteria bacterium RIFCSPHIGHO2_12_FULL_38_30]OGZ60931.1 MAG: hypothetical protein A3A00_02265 [Candidatus Spechtbacteria bacterium RIFCSPLOWO2_01_FULL_38_20]OGZ62244.1 MAG: hypothetical protein A3F94_02865 [Candidatus Spechtbacteria bacterium RIFCSPLOWO2_12_FULL_38_22]